MTIDKNLDYEFVLDDLNVSARKKKHTLVSEKEQMCFVAYIHIKIACNLV